MKQMISVFLCILFLLTSTALAMSDDTLTIAGEVYPETEIEVFQKKHPGIKVVESDRYETREIVEDAVSHADTVDLYLFHTLLSPTYQQLRDRGFLLPIEDEKLLNYMDGLYPELSAACKNEETICAIPISMIPQFSIFVNLNVWKSIGYTEQDLPSTWGEFIRFLAEEGPSIASAHEDVSLLDQSGEDISRHLLQSIENNYNAYRNRCAEKPGFDTTEFREILSAFSEIQNDVIANRGGEILFWTGLTVSVFVNNVQFLPLSFVEGEDAVVPVGLIVGAINPNSKHIPEAIELLQIAVDTIDPIALREMNQTVNTPVEDESYAEELEQYAQMKESYAARIEAAKDDLTKSELQQEWTLYDENMQTFFSEYRYSASVESIQEYRNYIQGRLTPIYDENISREEYIAVNKKREQFLAHQISSDQYINELERRFVFNSLEGR